MTAICRGSQGAVRLREGDYVAYVTVKLNYEPAAANGRYLVGGFKVLERCSSHEEAAKWYRARGLVLPSNCFVADSQPLDFHLTGGYSDSRSYQKNLEELDKALASMRAFNHAQEIKSWDASYQEKVRHNGTFIITEPIKLELANPIQLTDALAARFFGPKFPNTRSLRKIEDEQFWQLMSLLPTLDSALTLR